MNCLTPYARGSFPCFQPTKRAGSFLFTCSSSTSNRCLDLRNHKGVLYRRTTTTIFLSNTFCLLQTPDLYLYFCDILTARYKGAHQRTWQHRMNSALLYLLMTLTQTQNGMNTKTAELRCGQLDSNVSSPSGTRFYENMASFPRNPRPQPL